MSLLRQEGYTSNDGVYCALITERAQLEKEQSVDPLNLFTLFLERYSIPYKCDSDSIIYDINDDDAWEMKYYKHLSVTDDAYKVIEDVKRKMKNNFLHHFNLGLV